MTTPLKPRELDRIIARERKLFWERKAQDAREADLFTARERALQAASAGTLRAVQDWLLP